MLQIRQISSLSLGFIAVACLAVSATGCGKKSVENGALTQGSSVNNPVPGYPYPYPSNTGGQYTISVMQYVYMNSYVPFPILTPGNAQDYRALWTGIQVRPGDRLVLYPNSGGGWGVNQTRWGIFQTCSNQVGLAGANGRGALWASDGTRTYPIGMGGTQVIQNTGMLTIGFDVDDDGQRRCFWIPPSLVLTR